MVVIDISINYRLKQTLQKRKKTSGEYSFVPVENKIYGTYLYYKQFFVIWVFSPTKTKNS